MNFYPEQLRQLAAMCDAMNKADSDDIAPSVGMAFMLDPVTVRAEEGTVVGVLRDEIGGAWSFTPTTEERP